MKDKPIKIAILGLGSVGSKTVELIQAHQEQIKEKTGKEVIVKTALVRSVDQADKQRLAQKFQLTLTETIDTIVHDPEIDLVIELLGRIEPAKTYIELVLRQQKSVITANKDLIALHGEALSHLAVANGACLLFEASVGGGIPIVHTLRQQFAFDTIKRMSGILNGTTNFILTKMLTEHLSYDHALSLAQELGYAESDPFNDVSGTDAAYKLMVLAQIAYGISPKLADISLTGIEQLTSLELKIAAAFGYKVKLINDIARYQTGVELTVEPMLVSTQAVLSQIDNELNALAIQSQQIGHTLLSGPGAGAAPTASSVLADLCVYLKDPTPKETVWHDYQLTTGKHVYGIYLKRPAKVKKFTNEQLEWIETIAHQTVAEETYMLVTTKPIAVNEKEELVAALRTLSAFVGCLRVFESNGKEG